MKAFNSKDCSNYADQCRLISYYNKKYNAKLIEYHNQGKNQQKRIAGELLEYKQAIKEAQRGLAYINGELKIKQGAIVTLIYHYDEAAKLKMGIGTDVLNERIKELESNYDSAMRQINNYANILSENNLL